MQEVFEKIVENLKSLETPCELGMIENGRYILRDKAIEIVKQESEKFGTDTNVGSNGWIPCTERLPSKEEFIEEYCRNTYGAEFIVMIEGANRPTTLYLTDDGLWVDDCGNVHEVIAWQKLPESYQPKGE